MVTCLWGEISDLKKYLPLLIFFTLLYSGSFGQWTQIAKTNQVVSALKSYNGYLFMGGDFRSEKIFTPADFLYLIVFGFIWSMDANSQNEPGGFGIKILQWLPVYGGRFQI